MKSMIQILAAVPKNPAGTATTLIEAIGNSWPFLLVLVAGFFLWYFRKEIKRILNESQLFKFKTIGGHSLELERHTTDSVEPPQSPAGLTGPPEPEENEPNMTVENSSDLDLVIKMMFAFLDHDINTAEQIYGEIIENEKDPEKIKEIEWRYLAFRFRYAGDASSLDTLEALAKSESNPAPIYMHIALCFHNTTETERALEAYKNAFTSATTDDEKAAAVEGMAYCQTKLDKIKLAIMNLENALAQVTATSAKRTIYRSLAETFKASKEEVLRAIALEKIVELSPADVSARFDAAYSQTEAGFNKIAVTNYRDLLGFKPDHFMAKNNLGVIYKELKMPIHAIDEYCAAGKGGNVLSAANLAFEYLNAGFEKEANKAIEKAKSLEDTPARLGYVATEVSTRREKEQGTIKSIMAEGERKARFLRKFAEAYFTESPRPNLPIDGWTTEEGHQVEFSVDGERFEAKWQKNKSTHKLTGIVKNRAARITHTITVPLGEWMAERGSRTGFAYIPADGNRLHIMATESKITEYFKLLRGDTHSVSSVTTVSICE